MTGTRLTAEELRITPRILEALLWVRDALDPTIADTNLPAWMWFEMHSWGGLDMESDGYDDPHIPPLTACGTSCCIGGSMEMYLAGLIKLKVGDEPTKQQVDMSNEDIIENELEKAGLHNPDGRTFVGIRYGSLHKLFFDYQSSYEGRKRENAVRAIDRFLAGNIEDPWLVNDE